MVEVWHLNSEKIIMASAGTMDFKSWEEVDARYLDATMGMGDEEKQTTAALSLMAEGFYEKVAEVDGEDLERAWEKTNHIHSSWTQNAGVKALIEKTRSSSVGDLFKVNGAWHVAASFGFRACESAPEASAKGARVKMR